MSVVSLVPNLALCADAADIASRLRDMADQIEDGDFGPVDRVVVVVDSGPIDYRCLRTAYRKRRADWHAGVG